MRRLLFFLAVGLNAATVGTVVTITGGATDIVLDEARGRVYVVNSTQNRLDLFGASDQRSLGSIGVCNQPLSASLARNGSMLYVTCYADSVVAVVNLDAGAVTRRVALPAAPEGVAVGGDERVLITTVGTSDGANRLMLFDPAATSDALREVSTTLPAATAPQTPAAGRVFMSTRSNLSASADGQWIIGLNNPNATSRQLFVFEVSSGTVLRSRTVSSISNVLAVNRDGTRFMAGLSLFDRDTLSILAQQNTANSLHPFATNANFNTQQNQGGSVFLPDGQGVYSAFNIAPVQNPAARANVTQMMLSDPDNLLIKLTLQLTENLTGNMVVNSAGTMIYGLSQSGYMAIPVTATRDNPVAELDQISVLLTNDQCNVTSSTRTATVTVRNTGRGRMTASAQVLTTGPTQTQAAANNTGAGGGVITVPGPGGVPIVLPVGPGGQGGGVITVPGNTTTTTTQQTAISQTAPTVTTRSNGTETTFTFTYNSAAARSLGTLAPTDFLVQSSEAINVPARIRVLQNNRNSEARGTILPVPVSISTAEGLVDIVADPVRERLYIANSGLNRIEVFDTKNEAFLTPVKVGQLPRSLALTPNGDRLYVANTGGENITIIDADTMETVGSVKFPPVPYNASFALVTPSVIAATVSGVQIVMSDGTLWKVVNDVAVPRATSRVIGTSTIAAPRTLVASADGQAAILLGGTGTAYLFDAMSDEYVLAQTVASAPIQGYYGTVAAGPQGRYFVVNGTVLNAALVPVATTGVTTARPVAAVAPVNATTFARFTTPVLANATAVVRDVATVEMADTGTSGALRPGSSAQALEGPLSTLVGTQRVNVPARMMAVNASGTKAYVLTVSGLSVVQLGASTLSGPALTINTNGIVNNASYLTGLAPGSIVTIFGQNLAADAKVENGAALPTSLGGVCVTLDDAPVPLIMTSAGQINFQMPVDTKAGTHALIIRAPERGLATASRNITVAKYAPAVYVDPNTKMAAVYRYDGSPVSPARRAKRDELLMLFASGLGVTTGAKVTTGQPVPATPAAETDALKVFFGDPRYSQAEMIVDWSGLVPGFIGMYRIDLRVPGDHLKGDALPVRIRIGGIDSPVTGSPAPVVALD